MPRKRKSEESDDSAAADSMDCVRKTELYYHDIPPVQDSIEQEYFQDVSSESTTPNARTLEFNIGASATNVFLDLAKTYLKLRLRVVKAADDTHIDDVGEKTGSKLSVVNNLFHNLFSNIDVSLNDTFVTRSFNNYPYKSYIQNLLTYSSDVKDKGFLRTQGWKTDIADEYESATSEAFIERRKWIKGKTLDLASSLKCDLFHQTKLIPSQVNVKIRCVRADSSFALLDLREVEADQGNYKIVIDSAVLRVCKVQVTQQEEYRLIRELQIAPYRIPVRRTDVTVHTVAPGVQNVNIERVHSGQLPRLILVGLVDSTAFNGSINKNPFNFGQYGLESIVLYVNGRMLPSKAYTPDFENGHYVDSYLALCRVTGAYRSNFTPGGVSYEDFAGGAAIYPFSIAPETSSPCNFINPLKTGNISLEIKFSKPVPDHALNVILYNEFDGNNIFIGETRSVTTDYQ